METYINVAIIVLTIAYAPMVIRTAIRNLLYPIMVLFVKFLDYMDKNYLQGIFEELSGQVETTEEEKKMMEDILEKHQKIEEIKAKTKDDWKLILGLKKYDVKEELCDLRKYIRDEFSGVRVILKVVGDEVLDFVSRSNGDNPSIIQTDPSIKKIKK